MAGRRNKSAIKFVLQVSIKSEKRLLGIQNVGCFGGGLGCFYGPFCKQPFNSVVRNMMDAKPMPTPPILLVFS